ncbi:MAG: hypothetical protein WDM77_00815 [Steroidobacteraceae bacterium]
MLTKGFVQQQQLHGTPWLLRVNARHRNVAQAVRHRITRSPGAARSRMLDAYLGDIEYLMRERLWAEAVPLALTLPHICAAISDPTLRSSPEDYLQWCQNWVRPSRTDTTATVPTADALFRLAQARAEVLDDESGTVVPAAALRRLRLRRLSRATPLRRGNCDQ